MSSPHLGPGDAFDFDNVANFRDLGGYRTVDGREIARGNLFRSGSLGKASETDVARLVGLGLKTNIDLRSTAEVERSPDAVIEGCRNVAIDIQNMQINVTDVSEAIFSGELERLGVQRMITGTAALVRDLRESYTELVRVVKDPSNRPVVFHCSGGKDRAGMAAAILLLALGVDEETVTADYLMSNIHRAKFNRAAREAVREVVAERTGVDPAIVDLEPFDAMVEVRAEYIAAALDAMRSDYGSIDNYLRDALGLTDEARARLQEELLSP